MCEPLKSWIALCKDNKDILVMFGGFICMVFIYIDFKDFIYKNQEIQLEQAVVLKEISVRLSNVENRLK